MVCAKQKTSRVGGITFLGANVLVLNRMSNDEVRSAVEDEMLTSQTVNTSRLEDSDMHMVVNNVYNVTIVETLLYIK